MTTLEGQPPKTGWENSDDALREELRAELNAALAENERLRSALKAIIGLNLEGNKLARHPATHIAVSALRAKDNHLEQARHLLADTTDAVAAMQNAVHAKTP